MKPRKIARIVYAPLHDMGDIQVRQPLPSHEIDYLDPFILLHHGHIIFDEDTNLAHAGVGPHPHRGFSPVTFVFKGGSHHRDSRGNKQEVRAGGTQWMHAGMGIIHSERPVEHEMEIIQLWINSPAKNKMEQPFYRPLSKEDTPQYKSNDGLVEMSIISGRLMDIDGPIPTMTPINSSMMQINKNGKIDIALPPGHNAFIYLLDGKLRINGDEVSGKHMAVLANDGEGISIEGLEDTRALLMSAEPINEKIVAQGPFVMNSDTQIMEAYRDYRMGKMGVLVED
jgi:redox-sensitive bicupin YhaK (pirin superfamily)